MSNQYPYRDELKGLVPVFQKYLPEAVSFDYTRHDNSTEGIYSITRNGMWTFVTVGCYPEDSLITVASSSICTLCGGPFEAMDLFADLLPEFKRCASAIGFKRACILGRALGQCGEDALVKNGFTTEDDGRSWFADAQPVSGSTRKLQLY